MRKYNYLESSTMTTQKYLKDIRKNYDKNKGYLNLEIQKMSHKLERR